MSKNIYFFATEQDIIQIANAVEKKVSIQYFRRENLEQPEFVAYSRFQNVPDIYNRKKEKNNNIGSQYLVLNEGITISHRVIKLKKGGLRYTIDQVTNPQSIVLNTGRNIKKLNTILPGALGTVSENPSSLELFKIFHRTIRKTWEKVQSYFIGPEATVILDSGGRLAIGINSPVLYDLKREL